MQLYLQLQMPTKYEYPIGKIYVWLMCIEVTRVFERRFTLNCNVTC
jgi:hypothetical protein